MTPRGEYEPEELARSALAGAAARARAINLARADEVEAVLMAAVSGDSPNAEGLKSAERAAHRIAGSAGTTGMHQVSELARDLELSISGGRITEPTVLLHAVAVLKEIQRQLRDPASAAQAPEPTVEGAREILVVASDPDRANAILAEVTDRGWSARPVTDVERARSALNRFAPVVVVIDSSIDAAAAAELVADTSLAGPCRPTVVVGKDRSAALRAGADRFVPAGLPAESVVAAAVQAAGLPSSRPAGVVILAEPALGEEIESLLAGPAFEITRIASAEELTTTLGATRPGLVILDDPGAVRALRTDPCWAATQLILVTPDRSAQAAEAALAVCADDVVAASPLVADELVARVAGRLDQARLRHYVRHSDVATGLATRASAEAGFARLTAAGGLPDGPIAVALLDVDGLGALNEEHGYGFGDTVLRRIADLLTTSFRDEGVIARWAGPEFLVALRGSRRTDGVARVAAVLEALRNDSFVAKDRASVVVTFSGAVAEYPADGHDLQTLVRTLKGVLDSARRIGGNRVLPVGWQPEALRNSTDVFIVEDDEMLAGLLAQALDTRGLSSEHEIDGRVALERLTGRNRVTARVILLDVDLPGMNGLDVLRRLESEGVLNRSRVVMLTAFAGEQDVITAMRHGAFDHVAKPFSLPVLTQRLRRALDSEPSV